MTLDIRKFINEQPLQWRQIMLTLLLFLAMLLEGIDVALLSYVMPSLIKQWGVTRLAFAPALAASLVGLAVGTLAGGRIADLFGRRRTLIASVLTFGVATLLCAGTDSVFQLTTMRFISGLGFGSTVPCVLALLAEWLPDRANARMMVLNAISIPAGGMIGAELSSWLVPDYGWPTIFIVGGAATIVTGLALFAFLPELIGYLVARGDSAQRMTRLMQRMLPGAAALPADTHWILPRVEIAESHEDERGIFTRAYLRVNVGLWLCLFLNSIAVYSFANWVPTLLVDLHLPLETAIHGSLYYHTASIITTLLAALTVRKAGSRTVMLALVLPGLAIDLVLGGVFRHMTSLAPSMALEVMIPLACVGGCIGAVQGTLYAVAANAYPTRWRGTGVGLSSAAARLGGLTSSLVVSAILREGTSVVFFELIGLALVGVIVAILVINRHIIAHPGTV